MIGLGLCDVSVVWMVRGLHESEVKGNDSNDTHFSLPPAFHMCIYKRSSMAYHQVISLQFNLSTHWCRATPFCRHNLGMGLELPESLASLMSLLTAILQCEHFHRSQF